MAYGQGSGGVVTLDSENPTLPLKGAVVINSKTVVSSVNDALEVSSVPFVQHCLINFLLTLFLCMIAFCRLCPISPLQTVDDDFLIIP